MEMEGNEDTAHSSQIQRIEGSRNTHGVRQWEDC